jgi:hypothetical protein
MHVERKQGSHMGFHLVLERKHAHREREWSNHNQGPPSLNKGLWRFVHMKIKRGSKGILSWFLKENAHKEIMIREV